MVNQAYLVQQPIASAMTSPAAFTLYRALPSDAAELVDVQFRTFTDEVLREIFMGPDTPEGHENLQKHFVKTMKEDASDVWIKAVDPVTGKIAAASNWKVYQNAVPEHKREADHSWLKDQPEKLQRAQAAWDTIFKSRNKWMTEPYIRRCFHYLVRDTYLPWLTLW